MNNDELHIMLETLKQKKKFRDIDMERFRNVLASARVEYDSFSFDPAPFLAAIKHEGSSSKSVRPERHEGLWGKILSSRIMVSSLAAGAVAVILVVSLLFLPSSRQPADHAVCSFAYGAVTLHRGDTVLTVNAGTELLRGDRVVTGERSCADVVIDDTVKIRVRSHTSLMVSRILGREAGTSMDLDVNVGKGTVLFSFKKLGKGDIATVRTPTSVAGVRGTSFGVEVRDDRSVRYEVLEGKIRVRTHVDVSDTAAGPDNRNLQDQVDRILAQGSVTVSSNQVCTVGADAGERLVREINTAVKHSIASGTALNADALQVARPDVLSAEETGTRMLSDLRAISTPRTENRSAAPVLELSIAAFPDTASIKVNGDYRGKGNVTVVTESGVHTIEVSEKGYLPQTIQKQFSPGENNVAVRLEHDSGSFSLREWAAGASSSMLFTISHRGMLVNVTKSGMVEAVGENRVLWRRTLNSHLTAVPAWDSERMYCATDNEMITALSLADGRTQWSRKIEGVLIFGSAVELDGDSLFAGTSRGNVYRFGRNGRKVWRVSFDGGIFSSPFVGGDTVFVPVQDGNLYKVNRMNGQISGKINTGKIIGSSRIAHGSRLYLANYHGEVLCYNHELDTIEWRYRTGGNVIIATLLDEGSIYVINAGGSVYSLTLEGRLRWKTDLGRNVKGEPVIHGDSIYAITERALYTIDKHSGHVTWSYVMKNFPATGVAVSGDNLFIGTENKGIIVLRKD
jgi:outer membrane protein assembly factor BamB